MNKQNQKNRGAFFLEGSYLYIANDGNGFDRHGVIAIGMASLSAKGDLIHDLAGDVNDEDWISTYNKKKLSLYKQELNRLQTDKKNEDENILKQLQ